ncbi:MAG: O-antigen ligase family protein, partial [Sphingosinicella sp.]
MMLAGALLVVFVGIGVNRSLAAIGLSVPVLAASGLMIWMRKRPLPLWGFAAVALLLAGSVAAAFSAPFGNNLTSEEARNSQDSRFTAFKTTLRATGDFLPLGSGIATFPDIYRRYEDPQAIDRFYMNHAHSDYLELALETGVPGMILILLFLLWWGGRTLAVWRTEEASPFARAASIASAAILAHSLVDYPLRTAAIGALFAACCGLMAETRDRTRVKERIRAGDARHLSADASVD